MNFSEDNFVIEIPHDNEIDLSDGFYKVVMEGCDFYSRSSPIEKEWKDYFSKTLVPIRSRLISIKELVLATREIKELCGYWGNYLESVNYCEDTKCLRIFIGS